MRSVRLTERPLVRPEGFDLEQTWQSVLSTLDDMRAPYTAVALAAAHVVGPLRSVFGTLLTVTGHRAAGDGAEERVEVEIRDRSAEMIAARLAGFGSDVEVVGPDAVRVELARIGTELRNSYG